MRNCKLVSASQYQSEILKQFTQDDALVGGYGKIRDAYFMQEWFGKNDSKKTFICLNCNLHS